MALHDWTRVSAGTFHAFLVQWIVTLSRALNAGVLPRDYFAMPEQSSSGFVPDILTLKVNLPREHASGSSSGLLAVTKSPPLAERISVVEEDLYARRANRITIRDERGEVVSVVEILSPGNKSSRAALSQFVEKAVKFVCSGIHFLAVDVFPPGKRDPQGIHKVIWDEFREEEFVLQRGKDRVLASYDAGPPCAAYVQTVSVGETLPSVPLFLAPEFYIPAPLEDSYQATWDGLPEPFQQLLLR